MLPGRHTITAASTFSGNAVSVSAGKLVTAHSAARQLEWRNHFMPFHDKPDASGASMYVVAQFERMPNHSGHPCGGGPSRNCARPVHGRSSTRFVAMSAVARTPLLAVRPRRCWTNVRSGMQRAGSPASSSSAPVVRGLPHVLGSPRQAGIFRSVFDPGGKRGLDFAASKNRHRGRGA
jgi:hypothetical protein